MQICELKCIALLIFWIVLFHLILKLESRHKFMMAIANLLGGSRKSGAPPSQAGCEFLTPYAELITLTSLPGYSELTD